MLLSQAPFVPVMAARVGPSEMHVGQAASPSEPESDERPLPVIDMRSISNGEVVGLSKSALRWGMGGVAVGSLISGAITAIAFGSYRRHDSLVGPFVWSTVGSLAIGGALLVALNRAVSGTVDSRWMAAAVGAKLAA